jgi:hypothetical protein
VGWRQYFVATQDHAPRGTTTRARRTLLDAWHDMDETPHGRSLVTTKRSASRALERFSTTSLAVSLAVSEPFLS